MTKAQLIDLVNALRAENSVLRTQLDAARTVQPAARNAAQLAIGRLAARHPGRKSFTLGEVKAEVACSA